MALLWRASSLCCLLFAAPILLLPSANSLRPIVYPKKIVLKAGVIHAPPMAIVEEMQSGEIIYEGFQIDLLKRLAVLAAEDGVDLQVELNQAPNTFVEAFDLLANDCNTTQNPNPEEDCEKFDIIIGNYYSNAERFMRADLSPAWMRTSMATIKHIEKEEGIPDLTTLKQAENITATVCIPQGTYLGQVVRKKFPRSNYLECDPSHNECIDLLKKGDCLLYAGDELGLQYASGKDDSLEMTGESFNAQYFVWPMREDLPRRVSKLMKKWMYQAIQDATVDELYLFYYDKGACPIGTAGKSCELPCHPDHGSANREGLCICTTTKWTGDDCSIEVPEELNLIPQGLRNVCYGMAGANFILVAFFGGWVIKNRNRSQVKVAQPLFLMMILLGCVISTSTIFAMAQQDAGEGPVHSCAAIPWLYSMGFSLTFGAMFARIKRIYHVINSAVEMKRVTISAKDTLITVAIVLLIDVVILTIWTIVDPLKWSRDPTSLDVFGAPLESKGFCSSEHWEIFAGLIASFHFLLMATACYMCYLARRIPERISNGKYVGIAMFSNLQIFILCIPVLLVFGGNDTTAIFFVRSAAIWINDFMVVTLIFGNLMYKVYRNDMEGNHSESNHGGLRRNSSHAMIKKDIQSYAKTMRGISTRWSKRISFGGAAKKPPSDTSNATSTTHPTLRNPRVTFGPGAARAATPRLLDNELPDEAGIPAAIPSVQSLRSLFEGAIEQNEAEVPTMFTSYLPKSQEHSSSNLQPSPSNPKPSKLPMWPPSKLPKWPP